MTTQPAGRRTKFLDSKIKVRMDWFLGALAAMAGTITWVPDPLRALLVLAALVLSSRALWHEVKAAP